MMIDPYVVECWCCGLSSDEGSLCWQCEDCAPGACVVRARLRRAHERRMVCCPSTEDA